MASTFGRRSFVQHIAALWDHVKTFEGKYDIKDLHDQPYGMTEFHIGDPNDCLILVGQKPEI